jgi:hypothetical protein
MKMISIRISGIALLLMMLILSVSAQAQQDNKPRTSLKAGVMQRIGVDTDISIEYSRPGVKGREIWGKLIPYGLEPGSKYSKDKPFPWRGGANENTTIEFSKDVMVNGNKVPAGKYSLHFIPGEKEWTVIINKNNKAWGSFSYDQKDDQLRVTVVPVKAPQTEWLMYGFDDLDAKSCTAFLQWAELRVPIKISIE